MTYLKRLSLMLLSLAVVFLGVYVVGLVLHLVAVWLGIWGFIVGLAAVSCAIAAAMPDSGMGPR